jgi:putative ABC transport system permease protein
VESHPEHRAGTSRNSLITMRAFPPRFFLRFFQWYCYPNLRDHIEGDLIEVYNERVKSDGERKADRKFIIDVLLLFRPGIIRPVKIYNTTDTFGMYKSYFLIAARNLVKQRAHNILNILGLSMGIAAALMVAIHIREELSYEKSFAGYQDIYRVHREGWATSTPPLASEFRNFFPDTELIGRFSPCGIRVVNTDSNNPGEVTGYYADSSVVGIFGFQVLEGDANPLTTPSSAVITKHMAKRYFGNGTAVGKFLKFDNGGELMVTAVMADLPENTHLKFDYLASMADFYTRAGQDADQRRGWMAMYSYARLRPGSLSRVMDRMPDFIRKYYAGDPEVEGKVQSGAWRLIPLKDIHLGSNLEKEMNPNSSIVYVYVFMAVAVLILIVASANFTSMFTTQALRRMREVGMRKVMGAKSGQVMAQFLTEISLLIVFSAALAIVLYQVALPLYNNLSGRALTPMSLFTAENTVIAGIILLGVIVISGLYPAVFIARFRAGSFLREHKLPHSMPNMIRNGLLIFQFVVSISLIAAATVVRQQMDLMKNKDLGFDKDQVVTVNLYGNLWQRSQSDASTFKAEFLKNPDILSAGRVDRIIGERISVETVVPEHTPPEEDKIPPVRVLRADEDYLDAMNILLADGRNFSLKFNDSTSYIINERAAHALGLTSPVDEVLENRSGGELRRGKVVGVVKDYHFATFHSEIEPLVIEFSPGMTDYIVFKIRAGKTNETLDYIRATSEKLAPNSLFIYQFLDDRIDALYKSEDTVGKVFQFFSALAVVIACLGLFSLSSYTIESRTKEIAIRKVLGARITTIIALVSSGMFRLVLIGFLIAVPLTWYGMQKWLQNFAYTIEVEWWVFALTGLVVVCIASLAIGFRTLRAAAANPVNSLRNE